MSKETRTYAERKAKNPNWAKNMADRVCKSRRKTVSLIKEEAGGKCCICGYSKCIAALDFHHLDPDAKEGGIIGTTASLAKQREEAKKCILVCANCHREIHAGITTYKGKESSWANPQDHFPI
jgi:hypothetical protein